MTVTMRHGGELHVVRPDRVYRTSVLTPIVGYQPQVDVQAVARSFTQGPPLGMMLQGLHGNPFENMMARIRAFFSRAKVNRAVASGKATIVETSPGPASMEARDVAPQMQSQMHMLALLTQHSNSMHVRGPMAAAIFALQTRRPFSYYYAG